jgi:hypothetical protein
VRPTILLPVHRRRVRLARVGAAAHRGHLGQVDLDVLRSEREPALTLFVARDRGEITRGRKGRAYARPLAETASPVATASRSDVAGLGRGRGPRARRPGRRERAPAGHGPGTVADTLELAADLLHAAVVPARLISRAIHASSSSRHMSSSATADLAGSCRRVPRCRCRAGARDWWAARHGGRPRRRPSAACVSSPSIAPSPAAITGLVDLRGQTGVADQLARRPQPRDVADL